MEEEKVPLRLARDQMLGVETSMELTARRANKAVGQRNRYRENALRLACENLTLRGACGKERCGAYCPRALKLAGDDYSERGDAFLD